MKSKPGPSGQKEARREGVPKELHKAPARPSSAPGRKPKRIDTFSAIFGEPLAMSALYPTPAPAMTTKNDHQKPPGSQNFLDAEKPKERDKKKEREKEKDKRDRGEKRKLETCSEELGPKKSCPDKERGREEKKVKEKDHNEKNDREWDKDSAHTEKHKEKSKKMDQAQEKERDKKKEREQEKDKRDREEKRKLETGSGELDHKKSCPDKERGREVKKVKEKDNNEKKDRERDKERGRTQKRNETSKKMDKAQEKMRDKKKERDKKSKPLKDIKGNFSVGQKGPSKKERRDHDEHNHKQKTKDFEESEDHRELSKTSSVRKNKEKKSEGSDPGGSQKKPMPARTSSKDKQDKSKGWTKPPKGNAAGKGRKQPMSLASPSSAVLSSDTQSHQNQSSARKREKREEKRQAKVRDEEEAKLKADETARLQTEAVAQAEEDAEAPPMSSSSKYTTSSTSLSTKERVLRACKVLAQLDNHGSHVQNQFERLFSEQLTLMVEKEDRDLTAGRRILTFPTGNCKCDVAPPTSQQMGAFRTWGHLRQFFEGAYQLDRVGLKVIRVYQYEETKELEHNFKHPEPPLFGVDCNGFPSGAQTFTFTDPEAKLYVFAEQSPHAPSCIFRVQVKAIVETNVFSPTLAKGYFSV